MLDEEVLKIIKKMRNLNAIIRCFGFFKIKSLKKWKITK